MFTPIRSLAGGALIGVAAAILLWTQGRIAGISGIVGGTLRPGRGDLAWRWWFLLGLVGGGVIASLMERPAFPTTMPAPPWLLIASGLLVGFGTQLGQGCTSGHGVCGIGRRSTRSLVATLTFMATGAASVFVFRHLLGGGQ
jgi:uncharacterized membrane protein YedE/YeeE